MHWVARFGRLQIRHIILHVRVRIFSGSKDCVRREVKRAFNRDLKRDVRSEERISRGRAFHRGQTRTKYTKETVWYKLLGSGRRDNRKIPTLGRIRTYDLRNTVRILYLYYILPKGSLHLSIIHVLYQRSNVASHNFPIVKLATGVLHGEPLSPIN